MSTKTVCMISSLHGLYDDRIYWKEALSLKKAGYNLIHIGVTEDECDFVSDEGIRLIGIKKQVYFNNIYLNKLFETLTFRKTVYAKILEKADELKADVYHFHDLQINKIGSELKKLKHKPKVVYDVHEPYSTTYSTISGKSIIKKALFKIYGLYIRFWELNKAKKYDYIIATEENVRKHFINPKRPSEIIYNYSDLKPEFKDIEKVYDLIYCGGIRIRRGAFEMIEALTIAKKTLPKIKLLLIGFFHDNNLEYQVRKKIKELNLDENIKIIKNVPYKEVIKYYEQSKVGMAVFLNIKVNRLIMPIKIFEYITFKIPVIASNFGHIGRVTEENNTGIIINPKNTSEIANAMITLLTNKTTYNEISNNCEKTYKTKFNWSIMELKLAKIYENLL